MMQAVSETYGAVIAGGSVINLARVETADGAIVLPEEIAQASYTVTEHDPCTGLGEPVPGHDARSIEPAQVLFAEAQTGPAWQVDATGYNFRHEMDVSEHPAFRSAGRTYGVLYRLVPTAGQAILFRYSIRAL